MRDLDTSSTSPVFSALTKQLALVSLLASIAIWKIDFVLRVAHTEIFIFGLLLTVGLYGIFSTLFSTFKLKDDFRALSALRELYADCEREASAPIEHERITQERLKRPQIVYSRPAALSASHSLIGDELLKKGQLQIPTSTMQVLIADVQGKLEERLGLNMYLGAIMVLLGLLGTFIGLMHTLESVGDILASMNMSEADEDSVGRLIESLKGPLVGMAVGFGASLFGLVGSLVIGVLGRFQKRASDILLHDFETWLLGTVTMEASRGEFPAAPSQYLTRNEQKAIRGLLQVARYTLNSLKRISTQIGSTSTSVEVLAEAVSKKTTEQDKWFSRLAWLLQQDTISGTKVSEALSQLRSALQESQEHSDVKGQRLETELAALRTQQRDLLLQLLEKLQMSQSENRENAVETQNKLSAELAVLRTDQRGLLTEALERLQISLSESRESAVETQNKLSAELAVMRTDQRGLLTDALERLQVSLSESRDHSNKANQEFGAEIAALRGEQRGLQASIEQDLKAMSELTLWHREVTNGLAAEVDSRLRSVERLETPTSQSMASSERSSIDAQLEELIEEYELRISKKNDDQA